MNFHHLNWILLKIFCFNRISTSVSRLLLIQIYAVDLPYNRKIQNILIDFLIFSSRPIHNYAFTSEVETNRTLCAAILIT